LAASVKHQLHVLAPIGRDLMQGQRRRQLIADARNTSGQRGQHALIKQFAQALKMISAGVDRFLTGDAVGRLSVAHPARRYPATRPHAIRAKARPPRGSVGQLARRSDSTHE
jgi:hypothetical protein